MPRFSPAPVQQYRGTHSALRTYVGPEGELVMDTTQGRVVVMDGKTAGGIPLARLDELTGATFSRMDEPVELDMTAGSSIRYYITVDGSVTIPDGVSAPYWVWNYIVDDESTNLTLQFLRTTDGSIYNREGTYSEGELDDGSALYSLDVPHIDEGIVTLTVSVTDGSLGATATQGDVNGPYVDAGSISDFTVTVSLPLSGEYEDGDEVTFNGGVLATYEDGAFTTSGTAIEFDACALTLTAASIDTGANTLDLTFSGTWRQTSGAVSDWSEWVRCGGGTSDEFVTLDTEQTITGAKTFDRSYTGSGDDEGTYAGFALKTTVPYDETPEEAEYPGIWITDCDGKRIGKFEYSLSTNGARNVQMCVSPPGTCYEGSDKQIRIRIGCNGKGETVVELGDLTVGDTSTPIYLDEGVPTACEASAIAIQMVAATPNCYRRSELMTPNQTSITIHPTQVNINGNGYISTADVTLNLGDVLSASNRAGTDMYVYACEPSSGTVPTFVLSANSTVPSGYTADTSRKIGGFHCLCAAVGTISGHTLSGYAQGDILPLSVWDLNHRAVSENEGMVWIEAAGAWVDIYMSSYSGSQLVSEYGGSTVTGTTGGKKMHGEMLVEELGLVKKRLIWRDEFVVFAKGSNEGTNISGSSNPGTTGGHSDTAGRRMISNYGIEDCCGVWYQWTGDCYAFPNVDTNVANSLAVALAKPNVNTGNWYASYLRWDLYEALSEYGGSGESATTPSSNQAGYSRIHHQDIDGNNRYGDMYGGLGRALVGCNGGAGSRCGSRSVSLSSLSAYVSSIRGGRGAARARAVGTN